MANRSVPSLVDDWGKAHDEAGKYEVKGDAPLSLKAIAVKLPIEVYEAIKAMPRNERGDWLRMVICEAARLDGLMGNNKEKPPNKNASPSENNVQGDVQDRATKKPTRKKQAANSYRVGEGVGD